MSKFHTLFTRKAGDEVLDKALAEAAHGRVNSINAAISTDWAKTMPSTKKSWIRDAQVMLASAKAGDTLSIKGYKKRASLCAVLALVSEALANEAEPTDEVIEETITEYAAMFAPKARSPKAPSEALPVTGEESTISHTAHCEESAISLADTICASITTGDFTTAELQAIIDTATLKLQALTLTSPAVPVTA